MDNQAVQKGLSHGLEFQTIVAMQCFLSVYFKLASVKPGLLVWSLHANTIHGLSGKMSNKLSFGKEFVFLAE